MLICFLLFLLFHHNQKFSGVRGFSFAASVTVAIINVKESFEEEVLKKSLFFLFFFFFVSLAGSGSLS